MLSNYRHWWSRWSRWSRMVRYSHCVVVTAVMMLSSSGASAELVVAYNQLGYLPHSVKLVRLMAESERAAANWSVRSGSLKLTGKSTPFSYDSMSAMWVATVDVSEIQRIGNVSLKVEDSNHRFVVSSSVYDGLLQQLLRSYYLQRCGVELADRLTQLAHSACHVDDGEVSVSNAVDAEGTFVSAGGGWHDAGDYGKYVSTTAVTVSQLLHLFERYPEVFSKRSHYIPESGNKVPDILDEMRVGLDWLVAMQRKDGAFYRKLSGKSWPTLIPPDEDNQTRFLFGVATDDSAKAVAALARAARVFRAFDRSQSAVYLAAARRGLSYLSTQESFFIDLHEDDDKGSGPYRLNKIDRDPGLTHHDDDLLAAYTQLYLSTGNRQFGDSAIALLGKAEIALFEWKNPSLLSVVELLEQSEIKALPKLSQLVLERLTKRAVQALSRVRVSDLGVANHRIVWGSNKMTAAEGSLLLYANELSGNPEFVAGAQKQLDYLLGANPMQQTFVSGVGERPVKNVSHIFARAIGRDIPGLFVGGPNEAAQAGKAPKNKGLRSYIDDPGSYATNEYAIDYNAALIALVVQLLAQTEPQNPAPK